MKIAVNTRGFANILATATCMNHEVLSAENYSQVLKKGNLKGSKYNVVHLRCVFHPLSRMMCT